MRSEVVLKYFLLAFVVVSLVTAGYIAGKGSALTPVMMPSVAKTLPEEAASVPTSDNEPIATISPTTQPKTTKPREVVVIPSDWPAYTFLNDTTQAPEFEIRYPTGWDFTYGTLTNYDRNDRHTKDGYPEDALKCEMGAATFSELKVKSTTVLFNEDGVSLIKSLIIDESDGRGPGLGDAVLLTYSNKLHDPYSIFCYQYPASAEKDLIMMFKSVRFL